MDRRNVLFILSDQHNAKVLGHAGHRQVQTPNLDRLASAGTRFPNTICQNPICTPSRMCYLSGQYCHNHGYYGLSGPHPGGLPSLLSHFHAAGYRTGAIGKIHCPEEWVEPHCDLFEDTCGSSSRGRSRAYVEFLEQRGALEREDHIGLAGPDGEKHLQSMEGCPSAVSYEESQEGWLAATGRQFMGDCARAEAPFFLHVSLPRPHQCATPSEPFWSMYEDVQLELPPNADYDLHAAGQAPHLIRQAEHARTGNWTLFEPRTFEAGRLRKLRSYLGAVSQVDHAVGQLVDFLDEAGLADSTIVVYGADHGDYATEHGIMEKAPGISHDAITRVPFIWRVPGVTKPGHAAPELVESVDLAPTVCQLAGLDVLETFDGHDLRGLLAGGSGALRRAALTEFAWSKSLRMGEFRYVWYPREMFAGEYPAGFGELYDLAHDPWEMRNLYFEPEYQGKVRELQAELLDLLVTTTRPVSAHCFNSPYPGGDNEQRQTHYRITVNADGKMPPRWIREQLGRRNYL